MIRRWSIVTNLPLLSIPREASLCKKVFATNVMVSVANLKLNEKLVSVTLQSNDRAPLIGFLHLIHIVIKIEMDGVGLHSSLVKVEYLEWALKKAREHALNCSRSLTFRSKDICCEFDDVVTFSIMRDSSTSTDVFSASTRQTL